MAAWTVTVRECLCGYAHTEGSPHVRPKGGESCLLCGHRVAMTAAQRSKAYRARKRALRAEFAQLAGKSLAGSAYYRPGAAPREPIVEGEPPGFVSIKAVDLPREDT